MTKRNNYFDEYINNLDNPEIFLNKIKFQKRKYKKDTNKWKNLNLREQDKLLKKLYMGVYLNRWKNGVMPSEYYLKQFYKLSKGDLTANSFCSWLYKKGIKR
jgi:hypothetical protein